MVMLSWLKALYTVRVYEASPAKVVAVAAEETDIIVVPTPTGVTTPVSLTVATWMFELSYETLTSFSFFSVGSV